jgi:RecA/RadA recombinase
MTAPWPSKLSMRWCGAPLSTSSRSTQSCARTPEQKDTDASASRGARQGRLLSEALRRLAAGVDRTRTLLLFGNRTMPAANHDLLTEPTAGGRALPFYASVRIELKQRALIRETFDIVGTRVEATTIKNKVAPPLRVTTLDLMFGEGFARE